jgi:hypothetical protein
MHAIPQHKTLKYKLALSLIKPMKLEIKKEATKLAQSSTELFNLRWRLVTFRQRKNSKVHLSIVKKAVKSE